ncbi:MULTISPECIES: hypothetical protein [unclassified Microbacterium]|uniref:hypothetical protein n=1 Tax=unclassified Microbacterium TaxID=2609290 RepID=UPI00109B8A26|nr:hypothetical protein [Microbacterium sp. K35]
MAVIQVEVPDRKILEHLVKERRLIVGEVIAAPQLEVATIPATANTDVRHQVQVSLVYQISGEEMEALRKA